ncbi:MAG: D-tyrosyl-tRNA(Tyr) deacylase [Fibrobacteria bacterium]|nr:D-tyrosyl-tRNA(Tyr) deacylase [Fibrobacteria bacterium]
MKVVLQRVQKASVTIDGKEKALIGPGLLIYLGISTIDTQDDIDWLVKKISKMRVFPDDKKPMNRSVLDIDGEVLVISQFTLFASTKKGNRPSFTTAAAPEIAIPLYEDFLSTLQKHLPRPVQSGVFGADMKIASVNDGPVTISIDSNNRI